MGLPVEVNNLMMGAVGGYQISRSLRFRSSASAYLNRTPSSTTNQKTWTYSFWIKRGVLGSTQAVFSANVSTSGNTQEFFYFRSDNTIQYTSILQGTAAYIDLYTTPVFRDPSAWYHIVVAIDTTQATSSNRAKIYVNGIQITAFSTATYPSQNYNTSINTASVPNYIGWRSGASEYTDAYYAEVNFIDGQALTPSSFGETDSITGVWNPKKYSGTYGTNGFYLNFSDNSGATATTIGKDSSGNGNNWTPNNISVTAGTTYDSMIDSPTPYADGGNGRGNYAVLNVLDKSASLPSPTNGNLSVANAATAWHVIRSTTAVTSGKWYAEVTQTGSNSFAGVTNGSTSLTFALYTGTSGLYAFFNNGSGTTGYPYANGTSGSVFTIASGDVIGLAYDYDAQTLAIYRNGTLQATVTSIPKTDPMFFCAAFAQTSATQDWNFGQRPFSYTPPSGYNALNTYNLPAASISNGANHFAATTYTGTGATQNVSNAVNGVSFQPDFAWIKVRSTAAYHALVDSLRVGTGGLNILSSNATDSEWTSNLSSYVTGFNSNGIALGNQALTAYYVNRSGDTYVGWQWKGGGTAVTNNNGTISSQVSANTSAGFSIATFTTSGGSNPQTIGHGLGVAPSMIIMKSRNNTSGWTTYHSSVGNTGALNLSATTATSTSIDWWQNTSPTSSVWSIGANLNISGWTWVAYCFSAVRGYSAFGSYSANGSTDGPFIYTGFRPRFILSKRTDSSTGGNWQIEDTSRATYNVVGPFLRADTSDAEGSGTLLDILSNGFKLRTTDTGWNASGGTYIYAAFAENPFNSSRAR